MLTGLGGPRVKPARSRANYSRERLSRVDGFRGSRLSVSAEGAVVHDSGSGTHVTRGVRLLVRGSVRRTSGESRLKVQGTPPGAHVPRLFAVRKLPGLCVYDPVSRAGVVSQTQAWASGWMYRTGSTGRGVYTTHPSTPTGVHRLEVGRESALAGVDPTPLGTWGPTHSVRPTSAPSTLVQDSAVRSRPPQSLGPEDPQFSEEEVAAPAPPTVTGHHGRQCSCRGSQ